MDVYCLEVWNLECIEIGTKRCQPTGRCRICAVDRHDPLRPGVGRCQHRREFSVLRHPSDGSLSDEGHGPGRRSGGLGHDPVLTDACNCMWFSSILFKEQLGEWASEDAHIIFEYNIPRLGKRIDVVLLLRGIIFCLEFKVGKKEALQSDLEQVLDYALDLKNFHLYSAKQPIVPVLIPTNYPRRTNGIHNSVYHDGITNPLITGEENINYIIKSSLTQLEQEYESSSWGYNWIISPYSPTPTIIEAARTLYENHSDEDITRHEADNASTDATISYILDVINHSNENGLKSICFVTGVPGAGKTLVGLDVAIKQTYQDGAKNEESGAVYLSGNGPLVAVLTEALAQDNQKKCREKGEKNSKTQRIG